MDEGSQHLSSGEDNGTIDSYQHWEVGEKVKYACFKCDRFKPECYGARTCNFDKKTDGTALNT